jgi:hypothetical protein
MIGPWIMKYCRWPESLGALQRKTPAWRLCGFVVRLLGYRSVRDCVRGTEMRFPTTANSSGPDAVRNANENMSAGSVELLIASLGKTMNSHEQRQLDHVVGEIRKHLCDLILEGRCGPRINQSIPHKLK